MLNSRKIPINSSPNTLSYCLFYSKSTIRSSLTLVLEEKMGEEWEAVWAYMGQTVDFWKKKQSFFLRIPKESSILLYKLKWKTGYAILLGSLKGESPGSARDNSTDKYFKK